jgi:hypothetical protein
LQADIGLINEEVSMMSPIRFHASTATLILVLAVPAALQGQPVDEATGSTRWSTARVRPADSEARKLMDRAVVASPTIARMMAELEYTDLIVSVQMCPLPRLVNGEARVVAAAGGVRHVRIQLSVPRATSDLIIVLGHELRHALEFAAMPEIRDGESQTRAYRLMGASQLREGWFETEAALEAGRIVAQELKARH